MGKLQEILESGQAPGCIVRGARFTPGYDPFLARCPGDPTAVFTSEKERDHEAVKRGSIKMSGDEYMDWQDGLKARKKRRHSEDLRKAISTIPPEVIRQSLRAVARKRKPVGEKISIAT